MCGVLPDGAPRRPARRARNYATAAQRSARFRIRRRIGGTRAPSLRHHLRLLPFEPKRPYESVDFHAVVPDDPITPKRRVDFLSNENPIELRVVGTFAGRAIHSNHMPSRIWAEYAALDLRNRKVDPEPRSICSNEKNDGLRFEGNPKSNLHGNRLPNVKTQQIRLLKRAQSSSPFKGF
jgi:hypothetical protein